MFGYVRPNLVDMTAEEQARYRAHYCGLCHAIGARHGQLARMALTFDLTYLTIFLGSLYEPEEASGEAKCIPHPVKPHGWTRSKVTDYAADMTIVLTYHKLLDDWQDDHNLAAKGASAWLKKAYAQVSAAYPRQCQTIERTLRDLAEVEKRRDPSPDAAARCFGELMAELFVYEEDLWAPTLRQIGFALGRFIYLADAAEDFAKDQKKHRYNPFQTEDWAQWEAWLVMAMGRCTRFYDMLPIVQDKEILDNILFSGVWTRFRAAQHRAEKRKEARHE